MNGFDDVKQELRKTNMSGTVIHHRSANTQTHAIGLKRTRSSSAMLSFAQDLLLSFNSVGVVYRTWCQSPNQTSWFLLFPGSKHAPRDVVYAIASSVSDMSNMRNSPYVFGYQPLLFSRKCYIIMELDRLHDHVAFPSARL